MNWSAPPTDCTPGPAGGNACVRGTVGCPNPHDDVTLLQRLDAAEAMLVEAMALPTVPPDVAPWEDVSTVTRDWKLARCATINAASARCMAAAARALVSVEEAHEADRPWDGARAHEEGP